MVSGQNIPNPGTTPNVATGRGFVTGEPVPTAALPQNVALTIGSHVSWGSVIAGTLLTVSLLVLSSVLAYACGVPAFRGGPYGLGAGIWSLITSIIAFSAGGWVAAYLAPNSPAADYRYSMLRGVATWALAVPLIFLLFGGFGGGMDALMGRAGVIASDVNRMTVDSGVTNSPDIRATHLGLAWGTFIALAAGLICAAMAGSAANAAPSIGEPSRNP